MLGGAAVAVLVLVAGLWYFLHTPAPTPVPGPVPPIVEHRPGGPENTPAVEPSAVDIDTEPWTRVTLTPAAGGDAVTCTTPCQLQLVPGDYQLAFENSGLSQPDQRTPARSRRPARERAPDHAGFRRRPCRRRHRRPLTGHAASLVVVRASPL